MKRKTKKYLHLFFYFLIIAVGISYPLYRIWSIDLSGNQPLIWKFRCSLRDPFDSFRGRYVNLEAEPASFSGDFSGAKYGDTIYAVLVRLSDGSTGISSLHSSLPEGKPFIAVRFRGSYDDFSSQNGKGKHSGKLIHRFEYPFGRFYIKEPDAPAAEKILHSLKNKPCMAVVLVYPDGNAVLDDIEVDDHPIRELLEKFRTSDTHSI